MPCGDLITGCRLATHLVAINRPLDAHAVAASLFFPSPSNPQGISSKISKQTSVLVHELKRPNPLHYTLFELEPRCVLLPITWSIELTVLESVTYLATLASQIRIYNNLPHLPDVWEAESHALKRALDFGIFYLLRSIACEEPQGTSLPAGVKEPEKGGADVRDMVFLARAIAVRYGRAEYRWLIGDGANGEMEPRTKEEVSGWKAPTSTLVGFNANARWKMALLEGY